MKRVAIIQSNYIPWKGYFNIIRDTDEFVMLDDVQYTRRDWRNRNLIKTPHGLRWLTIPVSVRGNYYTQIKDVTVAGDEWRVQHWNLITEAYKGAKYFNEYREQFEELYLRDNETNLSRINLKFIQLTNAILKISTPLRWSMEFNAPNGKSERLLHICKELNATEYVSGPAAKGYLDEALFIQNGIHVCWADYGNYPEYTQLTRPFEHGVSIIDLIFNEGPRVHDYLKRI